jgi:hypothetical protein
MAIAFDTAVDGGFTVGASHTYSHTCTGSNRAIMVAVFGDLIGNGDNVTGVTYGGVALTRLGSAQTPADRYAYLYGRADSSVPSGANNVVISSTSGAVGGSSASYTGCGSIESGSATQTAIAAQVTASKTTTDAGAWTVIGGKNSSGSTVTGGTGTTVRVTGATSANSSPIGDSNGASLTPGTNSLILNQVGANGWAVIIASLAPAGGGSSSLPLIGITRSFAVRRSNRY